MHIVGNRDGRAGFLVVEEKTSPPEQCDRKPRSRVSLADLEKIVGKTPKTLADLNRKNREFWERGGQ